MSNLYPMKMKAGGPRIRVVGTRSIVVHVLFVANENLDTFLLFIINEQGLSQSSQCLRPLIC